MGKIAAFIEAVYHGNEICHTTDAPLRSYISIFVVFLLRINTNLA